MEEPTYELDFDVCGVVMSGKLLHHFSFRDGYKELELFFTIKDSVLNGNTVKEAFEKDLTKGYVTIKNSSNGETILHLENVSTIFSEVVIRGDLSVRMIERFNVKFNN